MMDVFYDGTRTPVDEPEPCPTCNGTGWVARGSYWEDDSNKYYLCPDCRGTGYVTEDTEEIPY